MAVKGLSVIYPTYVWKRQLNSEDKCLICSQQWIGIRIEKKSKNFMDFLNECPEETEEFYFAITFILFIINWFCVYIDWLSLHFSSHKSIVKYFERKNHFIINCIFVYFIYLSIKWLYKAMILLSIVLIKFISFRKFHQKLIVC